MEKLPAYGATRQRQANVSYLDIERGALDVLSSGRRPSVEIIRKYLGRGSPATIGDALKRFWRDLGIRAAGDSAALTRLPAEVATLADAIWQKALALASQAAKCDDNSARERLNQLQLENEVRAQSYALREREWDMSMRERERALADAREQVSLLMKELAADRATMRAQVSRITELSGQLEACRLQVAEVVRHAAIKHRLLTKSASKSPARAKARVKPTRRAKPKSSAARKRKLAPKAR